MKKIERFEELINLSEEQSIYALILDDEILFSENIDEGKELARVDIYDLLFMVFEYLGIETDGD